MTGQLLRIAQKVLGTGERTGKQTARSEISDDNKWLNFVQSTDLPVLRLELQRELRREQPIKKSKIVIVYRSDSSAVCEASSSF